jgi:hypothetical protein
MLREVQESEFTKISPAGERARDDTWDMAIKFWRKRAILYFFN